MNQTTFPLIKKQPQELFKKGASVLHFYVDSTTEIKLIDNKNIKLTEEDSKIASSARFVLFREVGSAGKYVPKDYYESCSFIRSLIFFRV